MMCPDDPPPVSFPRLLPLPGLPDLAPPSTVGVPMPEKSLVVPDLDESYWRFVFQLDPAEEGDD